MICPVSVRVVAAVAAAALLIAKDARAYAEEYVTEAISYVNGKAFRSAVTETQEQASPVWNADEPNPPISARQAMRLADGLRKKLTADGHLAPPRGTRWEFEAASLCPIPTGGGSTTDKWFWEVSYVIGPEPGFGSSGEPVMYTVIVLMDGTVVEPEIVDEKRFQNGGP